MRSLSTPQIKQPYWHLITRTRQGSSPSAQNSKIPLRKAPSWSTGTPWPLLNPSMTTALNSYLFQQEPGWFLKLKAPIRRPCNKCGPMQPPNGSRPIPTTGHLGHSCCMWNTARTMRQLRLSYGYPSLQLTVRIKRNNWPAHLLSRRRYAGQQNEGAFRTCPCQSQNGTARHRPPHGHRPHRPRARRSSQSVRPGRAQRRNQASAGFRGCHRYWNR